MHYRGVAAPSRNKVQEEPVVTEVPKVRVVRFSESIRRKKSLDEVRDWIGGLGAASRWGLADANFALSS